MAGVRQTLALKCRENDGRLEGSQLINVFRLQVMEARVCVVCLNFVTFCLRPEATVYSVTGLEVLSTTRRLIQLHYTLLVCTWFLPPTPLQPSQPPHIHASSSTAGTLRDQSARGLWLSPPIPTCCRRVHCVIAAAVDCCWPHILSCCLQKCMEWASLHAVHA